MSAVWSGSANHCSGDGTAQWSRHYPGGHDGCAGHRLNSAHLKHFLTPSVRPGATVCFDRPFVNLNTLEGRPHFVCLDNFKLNFPETTIHVVFDKLYFKLISVQIWAEVLQPFKWFEWRSGRHRSLHTFICEGELVLHIHRTKVRTLQGATYSHLQWQGVELAQWGMVFTVR